MEASQAKVVNYVSEDPLDALLARLMASSPQDTEDDMCVSDDNKAPRKASKIDLKLGERSVEDSDPWKALSDQVNDEISRQIYDELDKELDAQMMAELEKCQDEHCRRMDEELDRQFTARMGILMTHLPSCAAVYGLSETRKHSLFTTLVSEVDELLRLAHLDPALDREKGEMQNLQAGLSKCANTGQKELAALWVHERLLAASEEGTAVDSRQIDEDFARIKRVTGMPKHGGGRIQPVAGAPAFHQAWNPPMAPPSPHSFGSPLQGGYVHGGQAPAIYGGRGHYGPAGGGKGLGGQSKIKGGAQKPIICGKCKKQGRTDLNHPHTMCPFTQCFQCLKMGHTRRNCPG